MFYCVFEESKLKSKVSIRACIKLIYVQRALSTYQVTLSIGINN